TIITPNADGRNDVLEFNGLDAFPQNKLTVMNRWGNVIYTKSGYQNDGQRWDGTRDGEPLPADTYYYILEFSNFTIKKSITLLRD
ncbi:MAG: gliding motility-associated C-terminal domain-containing protein, partial [Saprospiraceae bacterium]